MNPTRYLDQATHAALRIGFKFQEYRLAAIGIRSDGATVVATNKAVRIPGGFPRSRSTHAEVRLCRKLDAGSIVFVARVLKDGSWADAEPCRGCMQLLERNWVTCAGISSTLWMRAASHSTKCLKLTLPNCGRDTQPASARKLAGHEPSNQHLRFGVYLRGE